MSQRLPKGWVRTKLSEVCLPVATIQPEDSPDTDFTYFDIGGIDNENNRIAETKTLVGRNVPSRARQAVRKDDILFSTVRTYLRKIARVERNYPNPVASTGFAVIRPAQGISSQFLFFQVLSEEFLQPLHRLQTGTSYPAVRQRDVLTQPILLPPAGEQVRIATKLNAALLRLEQAEMAARRACERLQRYRVAVLQAAVTGELTREWRTGQGKQKRANAEDGQALLHRLLVAHRVRWEEAELQRLGEAGITPKDDRWRSRYQEPSKPVVTELPNSPDGWTWAAVEQVGEVRLGRQRAPKHHIGKHMRPYLRVANVFEDRIDTSDVKRMNFTPREFEIYRLEHGDILLNEGQSLELVGRPAMYRNEIPGCCFQNTLVRFRSIEGINPSYALIVFRAYLHNKRFQKAAKITTNLAHLGGDRFARLEFPVPPLAEQMEIVREVKRRHSAAGRMVASLEQQLNRARSMRQSLFREAFAGRLVPHDPNDEPASVLLDRARTTRETEILKPRGKPMRKSTAKLPGARHSLLEVLREHKKPISSEILFRESGYEDAFKKSDDPQEVVDMFYKELRKLTSKPPKVAEERNRKHQVMLRALP